MGNSQATVLTGSDLIRELGLWKVLAEDFRTHKRDWSSPGFHTLFFYRIGTWAKTLPRFVRLPVDILYALGFRFCRSFYGIELQRSTRIGRRFSLAHQSGTTIHPFATFGNNCVVAHCVTLDTAHDWQEGVGPVIGSNVTFSPGAITLGNIRIGDHVRVGPHCVVDTDVPSYRALFVPRPRTRQCETEQDAKDRNPSASDESIKMHAA